MRLVYILAILVIVIFISLGGLSPKRNDFTNNNDVTNNSDTKNNEPIIKQPYSTIATDLEVPWEIVFLPDGNMLVTERNGNLILIGDKKNTISTFNEVVYSGEGGLLGLTLHPQFIQNGYLYLYLTTSESNNIINRVERYRLVKDKLEEKTVIIEGISGSTNHNGGRIAFGPDGYLYITTGDAQNADLAQDKNSLNGKILRISDDGDIPADNPFGNAIYSLGHRNPQGIVWDNNGILWETEHGPSDPDSGFDEINIIKKGGNYGWPILSGDQNKEGFMSPVIQSGPNDTWAPSGISYTDGKLYFGGLRGEALYIVEIDGDNIISFQPYLKHLFGRIRDVSFGPDGSLYISTSNRDGRGIERDNDDKIIKIDPKTLN